MRIVTLVCASALSLLGSTAVFISETAAQNAVTGMSGGPSPVVELKPGSVPLPAPERDPAARSARAIECAQKADAQRLEGKPRKRFLHECRNGV